jgi:hypothetical protein
MDVTGVTNVPDGWISKGFDLMVTALGGVMLRQHVRAENQAETIRKLQSEHEVFRANVINLTERIGDVKQDTKTIINLLLKKP